MYFPYMILVCLFFGGGGGGYVWNDIPFYMNAKQQVTEITWFENKICEKNLMSQG